MGTIIGERIRDLRRSKGMTQEQLGVKLGVSKATVQKYEKGSVQLTADKIKRLCEIFGMFPRHFIFDDYEDFTHALVGNYSLRSPSDFDYLDVTIGTNVGETAIADIMKSAWRLNYEGRVKLYEFSLILALYPEYKNT